MNGNGLAFIPARSVRCGIALKQEIADRQRAICRRSPKDICGTGVRCFSATRKTMTQTARRPLMTLSNSIEPLIEAPWKSIQLSLNPSSIQIRSLTVPVNGRLVLNDAATQLGLCAAGCGVAQVFELGAESMLASGILVNLFPDWTDELFPLHAVHPSKNLPPAKVRASWISS
jgi:DNA-binding transcriptional LysR family regulator